jgi:hypothetical protein
MCCSQLLALQISCLESVVLWFKILLFKLYGLVLNTVHVFPPNIIFEGYA